MKGAGIVMIDSVNLGTNFRYLFEEKVSRFLRNVLTYLLDMKVRGITSKKIAPFKKVQV
jgi:hypothetical protein